METMSQKHLPTPSIHVHGKLSPFESAKYSQLIGENKTITQIVWDVIEHTPVNGDIVVIANDRLVPKEWWDHVRPYPGSMLTVNVLPADAETGRLAASFAVVFASAYVGGLIGGPWGAVAAATLNLAGTLAINALIPLPSPNFEEDRVSPALSVQAARNEVRPFSPLPQVLGRWRYTPPYGALPYAQTEGNNQTAVMLFIFGYGPLRMFEETARLGDTLLTEFSNYDVEFRWGFEDDLPITIYTGVAVPVQVNRRVLYGWCPECPNPGPDPGTPNTYDETILNINRASVDITFPNGIIQIKNQGDRVSMTIDIRVSYAQGTSVSNPNFEAEMTANEFELIPGGITAKTSSTIRESVTFDLPAVDDYTIRVLRYTPDNSEGLDDDGDNSRWSASWWTGLTGFNTEQTPITNADDACLAQVALSIQATEQLQGFVDSFNMEVQTICLDYDGTPGNWTQRATSNPASLFRYVLQGPANAVPLADDLIDIPKLEQFWEWCDFLGVEFNMVRDFDSTLYDTLVDVAAVAAGRPVQINGLWSVIYDDVNLYNTPVQMFTPRNSWNLRGQKQFIDQPHALRVRFVDRDQQYTQREITVYNVDKRQGTLYDSSTAERFETVEFNGLTTETHNTIMAQYQMAVGMWRQNTLTFEADVEHIICVQGSPIYVQDDFIGLGVGAARVKSIAGSDVTVDSEFDVSALTTTGMAHRGQDNTYSVLQVTPVGDPTTTDTYTHPGPLPAIGDLVAIGELQTTVGIFVVDSILPNGRQNATIRCFPAYWEFPQP